MAKTLIPTLLDMKIGDGKAALELERLKYQLGSEQENQRTEREAQRAAAANAALQQILATGVGTLDRYQGEQRRIADKAEATSRDLRDFGLRKDAFDFQKESSLADEKRLTEQAEFGRLERIAPGAASELAAEQEALHRVVGGAAPPVPAPVELLDPINFQPTPPSVNDRSIHRDFKKEAAPRAAEAQLSSAATDVATAIHDADTQLGPEQGRRVGNAALDAKVNELAAVYPTVRKQEIRSFLVQEIVKQEQQRDALNRARALEDTKAKNTEVLTAKQLEHLDAETRKLNATADVIKRNPGKGSGSADKRALEAIYKDITVVEHDVDDLRSQEQKALGAAAAARGEAQRIIKARADAFSQKDKVKYDADIEAAKAEAARQDQQAAGYRTRIEERRQEVAALQSERDMKLGLGNRGRPAAAAPEPQASSVRKVLFNGQLVTIRAEDLETALADGAELVE